VTKAEREYLARLIRELADYAGWSVEEFGVGENTINEARKVAEELEDGTWTVKNV
jgi:hypothetical protein